MGSDRKAIRAKVLCAAAAMAVLTIGGLTPTVRAADQVWQGSVSDFWALPQNWRFNTPPGPIDRAVFPHDLFGFNVTRTNVNLNINTIVSEFEVSDPINAGGYSFTSSSGGVLNVTNGSALGGDVGVVHNVSFNNFPVHAFGNFITTRFVDLAMTNGSNVTCDSTFTIFEDSHVGVTGSTINASAFTLTQNGRSDINSGGLISTSDLTMNSATTTLNVNNGGTLRLLGTAPTHDISAGVLNLNSGGSIDFATNGNLLVGGASSRINLNTGYGLTNNALLQLSAGADLVASSFFDVGNGSTGRLLLDGAGTTVSAGGTSDWGLSSGASANVNIQNGATASYSSLRIGTSSAAASAQVFGGSLTMSNTLEMGGGATARNVSLNVTNNSNLTVAGAANFNNQAVLSVNANSSVNFNGGATFTSGSTLNWNSGNVNIASGKNLSVDGGVVSVTAGGQALGNGVTLRVTNGGSFTSNNFFDVANGTGTGTLLVDGSGSRINISGTTDWGAGAGNNATVTFSNSGVGTYGTLRMSSSSGASTLNLASSSKLTTSTFIAGGSPTSNARINITGGTLNSTGNATFGNGALVNLSSGGLLLGGASTFSTGATLNQTGGTLVMPANNTLAFDGGVGTLSSTLYNSGTTLRVTNGGKLSVNGFLYAASGGTGTLLVDGNTSRLSIINGFGNSALGNGGGNTADVTFSNGATADFTSNPSGVLVAAAGAPTRLSVLSGATFSAVGLHNDLNPGTATITVNGGGIVTTGASVFAGNGTKVNLQAGSIQFGDATFSTGTSLNVTAAAGALSWGNNKTLAFDGGVGTLSGIMTVDGGKTLRVTRNGSTGGRFTAPTTFVGFSSGQTGTLLVDGAGASLVSADIANSTSFGNAGTATATFSNSGAGTFANQLQIGAAGTATFNVLSGATVQAPSMGTGFLGGRATINVNGGTFRSTDFMQLDGLSTLNFSAGSVRADGVLRLGTQAPGGQVLLTSGGNKVLRAGGLTMSATSKIDLNDNDMIVGGLTSLNAVRGFIASAYNFGNWDGNGITSTAAANGPGNTTLGILSGQEYLDNNGSPTFNGVNVAANDVLVKYTYYGDVDFNGTIDASDYNLIDFGFVNHLTGWGFGDADYSGGVDVSDYNLIDFAFSSQNGVVLRAMSYLEGYDRNTSDMSDPSLQMVIHHLEQFGETYRTGFLSQVPEPTSASILTISAAALLRRRRRGK